jgi:hypothetical protein
MMPFIAVHESVWAQSEPTEGDRRTIAIYEYTP